MVAYATLLKSAIVSGALAYNFASMGSLAEARSLVVGSEVQRFYVLSSILDGINHKPYRDMMTLELL